MIFYCGSLNGLLTDKNDCYIDYAKELVMMKIEVWKVFTERVKTSSYSGSKSSPSSSSSKLSSFCCLTVPEASLRAGSSPIGS